MTTQRPLAKALHTVTAVTRVAHYLQRIGGSMDSESSALHALRVLGYSQEQVDASPELFAACVKALGGVA